MTSRAYVFTINNPQNFDFPENWEDQFRYVTYQLECGESGTYHFQGYIECLKPTRVAAIKKILNTAHLEPRRGTQQQAINYAQKEDSRIAGPWTFGTPSGKQGSRNDVALFRDAITAGLSDFELLEQFPNECARFPRFISTVRRAKASADAIPVNLENLSTWQLALQELLDLPVQPRKVHWFHDNVGNVGKTAMAKHLMGKGNCFYSTGGKHADILFAYEGQRTVIFDFPRSAEEFVCYSVIEALKNGIITISKYESRTFSFPIPHVVIFANFEPDRSKLSADRWDVHHIFNNL